MGERKGGRPKGSTSLGIPTKGLQEVVDIVQTLYQKVGGNIMTFSDFTQFLGLNTAQASPLLGVLSTDYGLLEREDGNWKLSELGIQVANKDIVAITESFERNSIFKDLSRRFQDKSVTPGVINDHIKKTYKKGQNVYLITERFLESLTYINSLKGNLSQSQQRIIRKGEFDSAKWFKVIQLQYALNPEQMDIDKMIDIVADDLRDDEDVAIRTLAESMKENKDHKDVLKILINNLVNIVSKKHPNQILELGKKKQKGAKTSDEQAIRK